MIKRAIKFIGIAGSIGLGVYAYLHFSQENDQEEAFHLTHLPQDADQFIEFNELSQFSSDLSSISSILNCDLEKELLVGFRSLDQEDLRKATLAITDCNASKLAMVIETDQNLKGFNSEKWNSKKIKKGLWLFENGYAATANGEELDHLKPYLKESVKLRSISKSKGDLEQAIYSIHEVNIEKGKTHLSGFVVDGIAMVSPNKVSLDPRSFSELLPSNVSGFQWSSISNDSPEVKDNGLSEVVCFRMEGSENDMVALKMKIKTEKAQETFRNSGSKIGAVGNSKWLNEMISQMKPSTHYSLFKDWIICATSEEQLTEYARSISNKSWSTSKEYAHMVKDLGMNIRSVSFNKLDNGKWKIGQNAYANKGAYYNIIDIFDGSVTRAVIAENTSIEEQATKPIVALSAEPFEFINHYTKAKEWVIQDEELNLVLMTKNKEIIFKKKLDSPVMGEFKMVDALKNNKFQIAFNTENYIYLVDRKGRDVENFPIKLSATASNELAIVDYEKNKNYRLLQALDNGKVENYTINGKKVSGWKYKAVKKAIIYPITHLKLGKKDYLFTLNEDYEIQLLNRKGQVRHPLDDQPQGLDSFAFEIFQKENIEGSGIRYQNNGEQIEFVFGKGRS